MTGSIRYGCATVMVCASLGVQPAGERARADEAPPAVAGPADSPNRPPAAVPSATPAEKPAAQHAPDPTAGDRTALIVQDMVQHPPQAQIPSQDPSHLKTAKMKLGGLLDRSVRGTENSEVGRVIDVMTGDDGKPAALELDVGGFMGVGNRKIAVAWGLFDLSRTGSGDPLRVALSEAQVRSAPAADGSDQIEVVTGAAPVTMSGRGADAGSDKGPDKTTEPKSGSAPASAQPALSTLAPIQDAPVPSRRAAPRKASSQAGVAGSDGRL